MQQISPIIKLDVVLGYMANKQPPTHETSHKISKTVNIELNELQLILNKLIKDGYVDFEDEVLHDTAIISPSGKPAIRRSYIISFEGLFFFQNHGGYKSHAENNLSQQSRLEKLERQQRKNNERLTKLTFWIALASGVAAVYYIIEILIEIHTVFNNHGLYLIWDKIPVGKH
ncbi:hypothetical protein [Mucilaginibacter dorajii]|uniref:Uncharacterized protein n=1 Tax=Mucilaginibacter dorajii TaxID=692994 RepID=A0ABP7QU45_9SPHI|nr:hypothetical protein [Mucilaginibacter dorajii]MCS3735797.1 hypothetical protein [Mucilaginibacter dorajii]